MEKIYKGIDPIIDAWIDRHALKLYSNIEGGEVRSVYISSIAGECFQIWIDPPANEQVRVSAAGVEGRREDSPPQHWIGSVAELDESLERTYRAVLEWMAPSERFFPKD